MGVLEASPGKWGSLLFVMAVALVMRWVFYTGYFGSDEVTYIAQGVRLLEGDWAVSSYIGSIRYGVNLPVAFFMFLFGQNEFAASLWSILCSLGEVMAVYLLGRSLLGNRPALLGALVLAVLPLHVHQAGRLMADAPLALLITLNFLLFWHGEKTGRNAAFFLAGVAGGLAFWVKETTVLYLLIFFAYPVIFRRWNVRWVWMVAGFSLIVLLNMLFFWRLTGDPLYVPHVVQARVGSGYLEEGSIAFSPLYYLVYLFIKVWHLWLIPLLAVISLVLWWRKRNEFGGREVEGVGYLAWWAIGMILVFSLFPVSFKPLTLIPKQTNYMLMFVAPLALLAGWFMAQLNGTMLRLALALVVLPSIALSAMLQNSVMVFTANSKAAVDFAREHSDAHVYGPTNTVRAAAFQKLLNQAPASLDVRPISELQEGQSTDSPRIKKYAIVDTNTLGWGSGEELRRDQVPECWTQVAILQPSVAGMFPHIVAVGERVGSIAPGGGLLLPERIHALAHPKPAYVYDASIKQCDRH